MFVFVGLRKVSSLVLVSASDGFIRYIDAVDFLFGLFVGSFNHICNAGLR